MDQTTKAVSENLTALMRLHDLSTRALAARSNPEIPQKTIWTVKEGKNSAKLSTLDSCAGPYLSALRRWSRLTCPRSAYEQAASRLIDRYAKMTMAQRDQLEAYINSMTSNLAETDNSLA